MIISYPLLVSLILPLCASLKGIVDIKLIDDKCFYRTIPQIIRCQLAFEDSVKRSVGERPLRVNTSQIDDNQLRIVCCGLWDMTSCMKSAVIKWSHCQPELLRQFNGDIEDLRHRSDFEMCGRRYREGSIHCGFPVWATITVVVIIVVFIAFVTCFVHRFCRNRNQVFRDSIHLIEH